MTRAPSSDRQDGVAATIEHGRKAAAFLGDGVDEAFDVLRHLVEGVRHLADLSGGSRLHASRQVTLRDAAGCIREGTQRTDDGAADDQAQQRGDRARHHDRR